jgi:hypothetical protein
MKKSDLKELIKPLIKECIHEVLLEEGLLSNIVAEVAKGMQGNLIVESAPKTKVVDNSHIQRKTGESRVKIKEHRAKLMNSINSDAYNGIDLFENTQPIANKEPATGQANLGDSGDSGVDISSIEKEGSQIWKAMK